jgi:AcrR family transcriptional regulator
MGKATMTSRRYVSTVRAAAAAENRERVIEVASRLLREESIAGFSLEAVAKAAGVTRLTVYNQFGSRRGLLEAVFDDIARRGGLVQLNKIVKRSDPRAALDELVEIFCRFWSSDPALGRLHDAMAIDMEFAQALSERNERRRQIIKILLGRMSEGRPLSGQRDAVDLIFSLTSCAMFRMLASNRSADAACVLIKRACAGAIDRTG